MTTTNGNEERTGINILIELALGYVLGLVQFLFTTFGLTLVLNITNTFISRAESEFIIQKWIVLALAGLTVAVFPFRAVRWVRKGKDDDITLILSFVLSWVVVTSGLILLNALRGYLSYKLQAMNPSLFHDLIFEKNGPQEIVVSCLMATVAVLIVRAATIAAKNRKDKD